MKQRLYFLLFLIWSLSFQPLYAQHKSTPPNVIIIYSDDQGWTDLNSFGGKDLYTPILDSLASDGIRFTQFYAASSVCSPSRASLLTGRYPQRAGLAGNAPSKKGGEGMPTEQYTIGELFQDAGYKTAHIGKWHVGYTPKTMPNAQGFDYSYGFMGGCIDNYSHFFYWDGPNRHDLWCNGEEIYENGTFFPDLMVRETNDFIEENRENPFLIYFAIGIPHYPLQGEKKWLDYYADKGLASPRDKYAAFVSTMDEKIGAVITRLKEMNIYENTIIVFQSDHGFSEEERGFGGGGSAGELRGSKFSLFEGGTRVPAILSWPEKIKGNQVRNQLAANIDWYPTLAELCGITLPNRRLDGKSLVPVINKKNSSTLHDVFFWRQGGTEEKPQWAVRKGDWKLLRYPVFAKEEELDAQGFFLVHLTNDIGEKENLAHRYPERIKEMKALYEQWYADVYLQ